jgi:hypothetical protein
MSAVVAPLADERERAVLLVRLIAGSKFDRRASKSDLLNLPGSY